jgi:hypothetical protein
MLLSVRGKPSAFDLSPAGDMVAVASPGCLTFFGHGLYGQPKHVIHYEQPQQVRQLRYQKTTASGDQGSSVGALLGTLRGGSVAIFDPSKPFRPLQSHIQGRGW